jgi:hypothetical protein
MVVKIKQKKNTLDKIFLCFIFFIKQAIYGSNVYLSLYEQTDDCDVAQHNGQTRKNVLISGSGILELTITFAL